MVTWEVMSKEDIVKVELEQFLNGRSSTISSDADDIVLNYIVGIIEALRFDDTCSFDVEDFIEVMDAYLPGFRTLDSAEISEWMKSLTPKIQIVHANLNTNSKENKTYLESSRRNIGKDNPDNSSFTESGTEHALEVNSSVDKSRDKSSTFIEAVVTTEISTLEHTDHADDHTQVHQHYIRMKRTPQRVRKSSSRTSSTSSDTCNENTSQEQSMAAEYTEAKQVVLHHREELQKNVALLQEMFPCSSTAEIKHTIQASSGDMEEAVQSLLNLTRHTNLTRPEKTHKNDVKKTSFINLEDQKLKKQILQKYSHIDIKDDAKTHVPAPLKTETKKLIRYRDGQIVSKKGERFSEIKQEQTDEMKKTYVNLKPARQYRFH